MEQEDARGAEASAPKPPGKWEVYKVYKQILQISYYIVFDRYSDPLRFFQLEGSRYKAQNLNVAATATSEYKFDSRSRRCCSEVILAGSRAKSSLKITPHR